MRLNSTVSYVVRDEVKRRPCFNYQSCWNRYMCYRGNLYKRKATPGRMLENKRNYLGYLIALYMELVFDAPPSKRVDDLMGRVCALIFANLKAVDQLMD